MKLAENSKPTKFIKLDNDHYGTGTGVTLIRKDAFSEIAWNASDSNGYKNRYFGCTLDNFCDGIWPLKLDEKIRECLVPVPIVVAEGNQVATLHTIYRKGFAISCTEAGVSGWQTEGKAFSYFSDNAKRIAYLDETATAVYWGLRSPLSDDYRAYYVSTGGTVSRVADGPALADMADFLADGVGRLGKAAGEDEQGRTSGSRPGGRNRGP